MRLPVLGLARWRRFAKATASGRSSPCGLRPSHFPSLAGRGHERGAAWRPDGLSYSAKAPAIWRIIVRVGSSLAVRSSPEAVVALGISKGFSKGVAPDMLSGRITVSSA